jgi:hypothetical protein
MSANRFFVSTRCVASTAVLASLAMTSCFGGCADKSQAKASATVDPELPMSGTVQPGPEPTREVYPIDEIVRLGHGRLRADQVERLRTIIESPYWQARLGWLYVSPMGKEPLAVFYTRPWKYAAEPLPTVAYQIVGAQCPTWFMLSLHSYAYPMDPPGSGPEHCFRDPLSPDSKTATPLPVRPGSVAPSTLLNELDSMSTARP